MGRRPSRGCEEFAVPTLRSVDEQIGWVRLSVALFLSLSLPCSRVRGESSLAFRASSLSLSLFVLLLLPQPTDYGKLHKRIPLRDVAYYPCLHYALRLYPRPEVKARTEKL